MIGVFLVWLEVVICFHFSNFEPLETASSAIASGVQSL